MSKLMIAGLAGAGFWFLYATGKASTAVVNTGADFGNIPVSAAVLLAGVTGFLLAK